MVGKVRQPVLDVDLPKALAGRIDKRFKSAGEAKALFASRIQTLLAEGWNVEPILTILIGRENDPRGPAYHAAQASGLEDKVHEGAAAGRTEAAKWHNLAQDLDSSARSALSYLETPNADRFCSQPGVLAGILTALIGLLAVESRLPAFEIASRPRGRPSWRIAFDRSLVRLRVPERSRRDFLHALQMLVEHQLGTSR